MNARYTLPLVIVVVASAGALLSTADNREHSLQSDHHHNAIADNHVNDRHELDQHEDVAVEEMLLHAAKHLGTATAIPDSYVAMPDWAPLWELRWMDFHHGEHSVRVYHATHHDHPETRFVIAVDDTEHGIPEHWIPVR